MWSAYELLQFLVQFLGCFVLLFFCAFALLYVVGRRPVLETI